MRNPFEIFFRSRRRTRPWLGCFAIDMVSSGQRDYFFLPAMAFAGPLRVRVRWCACADRELEGFDDGASHADNQGQDNA